MKRMEKGPIFDQNYWLTPWENLNFWSVSSSFFYSLERHFLVLEYRKTHFPGRYWLKKMEKGTFFNQNHGLTCLENS